MDTVIREGALRLLANEGSADVILSCQGHRLMAHKVILSMASPVFRVLLEDTTSEPTVIILPDVSSKTMSSILDYIYTGSVIVYSNNIREFFGLAKLLCLQLDFEKRYSMIDEKSTCLATKIEDDVKLSEKLDEDVSSTRDEAVLNKKNHKKLPELVPLRTLRTQRGKRWNSCLLPSPWCPRTQGVYGDPRCLMEECHVAPKLPEYDPNNNISYAYLPNNFHRPPENFSSLKDNSELPMPSRFSEIPLGFKDAGVPKRIDRMEDVGGNEKVEAMLGPEDSKSSCEDKGDVGEGDVTESDEKGKKPFRCVECGKGFSQLRNYKYHRSVHEGTKEFSAECNECGKTFNDKGYLSSHMKIHRDKKEYGCPHCPKRFNQRVAYNMHLRIHTGVKPHECTTCGKSFSRKMLLKQHQRVHTGERPYSCPECGKTFADRSNMSLHTRLHTGEKPYSCSICPKSFTKKHHLKTHMNFHTGHKPYECEKCGLCFSQSSNMRTHYKKCATKSRHREEEGGGPCEANLVEQVAD